MSKLLELFYRILGNGDVYLWSEIDNQSVDYKEALIDILDNPHTPAWKLEAAKKLANKVADITEANARMKPVGPRAKIFDHQGRDITNRIW